MSGSYLICHLAQLCWLLGDVGGQDVQTLMRNIPGVPDKDYPILSNHKLMSLVKNSGFSCDDKTFGGIYIVSFLFGNGC